MQHGQGQISVGRFQHCIWLYVVERVYDEDGSHPNFSSSLQSLLANMLVRKLSHAALHVARVTSPTPHPCPPPPSSPHRHLTIFALGFGVIVPSV